MNEMKPLWNYVKVQNGYAFDADSFSDAGDIPLVRIRDILGEVFETFIQRQDIPSEQFIIRDGDLVIGMDGDFNSTIWRRGEAALNQRVCVVHTNDQADTRFIGYAIQQPLRVVNELRYSTTVKHLSQDDIHSMRIPIPPLEKQQRIADYLDRETAEIDAAVADLDKYVELLEKRRRRVVTQGFNDPKYNPVSQRLKFLTVSEDHRRIPIKSGDRVDMAGEYPYYGASGIIDHVNDYLWDNEKRLLLSEDGANLVMRNHPIAFVADGQYWVNNHAHVLKCLGETPPELVAKAIEVSPIAHLITGSAQPKLTAAAMGEIEFLFPLFVDDQKALLADLQPEMAEIDSLIAESIKLRDLLLKRRSVLIIDVVTGRKKV